MIVDLPFYENDADGNRCVPICGKIVLEHFLGKKYSSDKLDDLMGRKSGMWTYISQLVKVLHNEGLDVKYYSKFDLEPILEGEPFLRRHYGKDAEVILKHTDLPVVLDATKKVLGFEVFEKGEPSMNQIEEQLEQGHIPIVVIDNNKISGKKGDFQGHVVVITGFDEENVYFHESGPRNLTPNKKVNKELFVSAMNANGTDNDCVIVFGKRE
ncbi:MAG: peptidase C39 family protein [Nanoarchaeota archaeon]|nr:peptidase C39 family protein [Nanoarchaeota archaeon]